MIRVLKECFSINLNEYNNIGIDLEINKLIMALSAALMIGIVFLNLYRGNIKLVVAQLTRHGAQSEESAKTLEELKLDKNRVVKRLLSGDNLLTKIVATAGEKRYTYEEYKTLSKEEKLKIEKKDVFESSFYIREEKSDLARNVVERYGTSIQRTVISCVFVALITMCIIACMPGLLNTINNLLENTKNVN